MGKKSTPAAPDYTKMAEMTAKSQNDQLLQQTWANRATQTDAFGNKTSWNATPAVDAKGNAILDSSGKPISSWDQKVDLSPEQQQLFNDQQQIATDKNQLAKTLVPRMQAEYGKGIDWSTLSPYANVPLDRTQQNAPGLNTSMGQDAGGAATSLNYGNLQNVDQADKTRQNAYDNAYKMATSRLDPQYQQQQAQLESKLANQGITQGSDAYQKAMDQFSRSKTDAYNQAMMGATSQAGQQAQIDYGINMGLRQQQGQEALNAANYGMGAQAQNFQQRLAAGQANNTAQQQQFGMGMQAGAQNFSQQLQGAQFQNQQRQQQLTEMMQQRGFSLNEINAILSGTQVNAPQFAGYNTAGQGQGVDYSGAAKDQYGASMDAYNAAQANSPLNAAASLAGTAMKAYTSDARVKREIKRIGRHPRGYGIFTYRFIGERGKRTGVIAQDVARVRPDLVIRHNGVLMVKAEALEGVDHV
jgi:hypothetical protein